MGARLVRSKALDNWVVPGAEHQVREARDDGERAVLLISKLMEEATEVITAETRADIVRELADLLSVMRAIAALNGIGWAEVLSEKAKRDQVSGSYIHGLVWDTSR
jgi:phosphoribosyl-ATP pyrophosphohydrolase